MITPPSLEEKIAALERELRELERSLPQHSTKPSQLIRIEEIEEELSRLRSGAPSEPSVSDGAAAMPD